MLDLHAVNVSADMDASYEYTDQGTLIVDGFRIDPGN